MILVTVVTVVTEVTEVTVMPLVTVVTVVTEITKKKNCLTKKIIKKLCSPNKLKSVIKIKNSNCEKSQKLEL